MSAIATTTPEVTAAFAALRARLIGLQPPELRPLNTADALDHRIDLIDLTVDAFREYLQVVVNDTCLHTNCRSREADLVDALINEAWVETRVKLRLAIGDVQTRAA